jgi:hypothetical protein
MARKCGPGWHFDCVIDGMKTLYPNRSFKSVFFTAVALSFCLSTIASLWDGIRNPLDARAPSAIVSE